LLIYYVKICLDIILEYGALHYENSYHGKTLKDLYLLKGYFTTVCQNMRLSRPVSKIVEMFPW